jgi:hypothetical protein
MAHATLSVIDTVTHVHRSRTADYAVEATSTTDPVEMPGRLRQID